MTPDVRQMNYWLKNSAATVHAAVIWMFSALRNKGVDNPNVAVLSRSNSLISDMSMFLSEHHSYRGYIMKSRSKEMLDRAKAAMVAAVEIYNKPGFPYRAETFVILAINGWELLCKAKWLSDHDNRRVCVEVVERVCRYGCDCSVLAEIHNGNDKHNWRELIHKRMPMREHQILKTNDRLMYAIDPCCLLDEYG